MITGLYDAAERTMPAPEYCLEMWVPERERGRVVVPSAPILSTKVDDDWDRDGGVRWTIAGHVLYDGTKSIYPHNQLIAVLAVVENALDRVVGRVNSSGTIVWFSTEPIDIHRAKFAYDVEQRRVTKIIRNEAEHAEVVGSIRHTADSIIKGTHEILAHLTRCLGKGSARDSNGFDRSVADPEVFDRLGQVRAKYQRHVQPPPKRRKR